MHTSLLPTPPPKIPILIPATNEGLSVYHTLENYLTTVRSTP